LREGGGPVERAIADALDGSLDVAARVAARRNDYARGGMPGPVAVDVVVDESATDTLVEVHADDEIGLLFRIASTLADLGLDVRVAKVATLGARVVDVFYVRDAAGAKIEASEPVARLRGALETDLREEPVHGRHG
jgi:[protein-PII] uridylyltransferase